MISCNKFLFSEFVFFLFWSVIPRTYRNHCVVVRMVIVSVINSRAKIQYVEMQRHEFAAKKINEMNNRQPTKNADYAEARAYRCLCVSRYWSKRNGKESADTSAIRETTDNKQQRQTATTLIPANFKLFISDFSVAVDDGVVVVLLLLLP